MSERCCVSAAVLAVVLAASMVVAVPAGAGPASRAFTVIAVVDGNFSPYHYEFLGHQHPWNLDGDASTDFDFTQDPTTYLDGHPGAERVEITVPTDPETLVADLVDLDADEWAKVRRSSHADDARLYWLPGTKVVGLVRFSGGVPGTDNAGHGTRTAASAGGNSMGTCPECLFVLVQGTTTEALRWAASQPWVDVVTNSYGKGVYTRNDPARNDPTGSVPRSAVRDNVYFGSPIDATRQASERGQVVVFSAGNGFANAFDVPPLTYWSSEKGPDWIVTVGAVSAREKQTASGSGKPVDISAVGISYPSTGGSTVTGRGSHSGTSNAAPVVAGYFGKVLYESRKLLGDSSVGQSGGVVASGTSVVCGGADLECVLGDGELTREEWEGLVFHNVLPSEPGVDTANLPTWPTTEAAYYYQGHGVAVGLMDGPEVWDAEWRQMVDAARGAVATLERPPGEQSWFVVDSKCRQRLWGSWSGGYYTGVEPEFNPAQDQLAVTYDVWCSQVPEEAFVGREDPQLPTVPGLP